MIIERIRILNCEAMTDIDCLFSQGPAVITFPEISRLRLFYELLFALLFNHQDAEILKGQRRRASVDLWLLEEAAPFHIRFHYHPSKGEWEQEITLEGEECKPFTLQADMSPGQYFFKCEEQTFSQGGAIRWPEDCRPAHLLQRVRNMRYGGDEELSITKVRASIAGAQKRVKGQQQVMEQVKAEYEMLRNEWESSHRQQEEERLLQIEIKNLREMADILSEKIAKAGNIQDRINFLLQNPDYRELRQLQEEIHRLEERRQYLNDALGANLNGACADWGIIESYREECTEWAGLQKNADNLRSDIRSREERVLELEKDLQSSGYQGFPADEDGLLKRISEERESAQEKLSKLRKEKRVLLRLENLLAREKEQALDLEIMAAVTEADLERVSQKEKQLEKWRNSKLGGFLDGTLEKRLGRKSIAAALSSHLLRFYEDYQTSNYEEFTDKLVRYLAYRKRIEKLNGQVLRVRAKVNQETYLRKMVAAYSQRIDEALKAVHASDFREWLRGWQDYGRKKDRLAQAKTEIAALKEKLSGEERKLAACREKLRENLKNWGVPTSNREEVLAAVLNLAALLHEKNETDGDISAFSDKYRQLLGERDMEQLARVLEPLGELERELCFSPQERQADITAWRQEEARLSERIEKLQQRLPGNSAVSDLKFLEKKIAKLKLRWTGYEDLVHALAEAQSLLELSWQEWQTNYEQTLNREKQWISEQAFSSAGLQGGSEEIQALRHYFAYRMAIAQLAFDANKDVPLFFMAADIQNDPEGFWEEAVKYLQKLSFSRQILFFTADPKLGDDLGGKGWQSLKPDRYLIN